MAASGGEKPKTTTRLMVLLLLALLHGTTAEPLRCPGGNFLAILDSQTADLCEIHPNWKPACCIYREDPYNHHDLYICGSDNDDDHYRGCKNTKPEHKCFPTRYKPCCAAGRSGTFLYTKRPYRCYQIPRVIKCPQRDELSITWADEKDCPETREACCKYNTNGDKEYTCGDHCWDKERFKENPKECLPDAEGGNCCWSPDGGFRPARANGTCAPKPQPRCPKGPAHNAALSDCDQGCCVYHRLTKTFDCVPTVKGVCPQATKDKLTCKATAGPITCCNLQEGGFVPSDKKCCPNHYGDGYVGVAETETCPELAPLKCPKGVPGQAGEEPEWESCERGQCCAPDGAGGAKCTTDEQCNVATACRPALPLDRDWSPDSPVQKCCMNKQGTAVVAVGQTAQCVSSVPECPSGGAGQTVESKYWESGCCVYNYQTKIFSMVPAGSGGECPAAAPSEQTCRAPRGLSCCAHRDGGFQAEKDGKCASPNIMCAKAAGQEPEPCPGGTFKCCYRNACSANCTATEGTGKNDKCTPVYRDHDKGFTKCCLNEYGDRFVPLPSGTECPKARDPIRCPLEVAEKPKRETCGGVTGECCVLDGTAMAVCAKGQRCQAEGACQPGPDHKCCLSVRGTALVVVGRAEECEPAHCTLRKAAKMAECQAMGTEEDREACYASVEKCAVDDAVAAAGKAAGTACEEAWAKCVKSNKVAADKEAADKGAADKEAADKEAADKGDKGAGETHGPSLLLLLASTLLLLLH